MANKFRSITQNINGKDYTAQFNGLEPFLEATDNSYLDYANATSTEKMANYLFQNVLVSPSGIKINDFGKDQIGTRKSKTIKGVKYTAEFRGVLPFVRIIDSSYIDASDKISTRKLGKALIKEAIVEPETVDVDALNMATFTELVMFLREVMMGDDAYKEFEEVLQFCRDVAGGDIFQEEEKEETVASGAAKKG